MSDISVLEAPATVPAKPTLGYVGFYRGKRVELTADSLWDAKQKVMAALKVRPKDSNLCSVMLAEVDGKEVVHTADF